MINITFFNNKVNMIKNKKKTGEEPLATGVTSTPGGTYVEV